MTKNIDIATTPLAGVLKFHQQVFNDHRGYVTELLRQEWLQTLGLPPLLQENISFSQKNVIRGLHFQRHHPQGKLLCVLQGKILDVMVDLRPHSTTFGKVHQEWLDAKDAMQLWIPPGFAHGFGVYSEQAMVLYRLSDYYQPLDQGCIRWDDPDLNIDWKISQPILSQADKNGIFLRDFLP